jgi:hypothetical protein
MSVTGFCSPFFARVIVATTSGILDLQAEGFLANEKEPALQRVDRNKLGSAIEATSVGAPQDGDINVIARDATFSKFAQFAVHADLEGAKAPCTFWGTITPSS